jgi:hypothetical protein
VALIADPVVLATEDAAFEAALANALDASPVQLPTADGPARVADELLFAWAS